MRTIKFRGKDFLGRWHYGFLHRATGADSLMIQIDSFDSFGVIPYTVGQFTGLTDKNGNEIYEGDIVYFTNHIQGNSVIVYRDGCYMCDTKYYATQLTYSLSLSTEVIGNIHDNPELLKEA